MDRQQLVRRCPGAREAGTVKLLGYRLAFYGAADIEPDEAAYTCCVVWSLTQDDERRLDEAEGVLLTPPSYTKMAVGGIACDGRALEGYTYVMTPSRRARDPRPPEEFYFALIERAYRERGFDLTGLLAARERAVTEPGSAFS